MTGLRAHFRAPTRFLAVGAVIGGLALSTGAGMAAEEFASYSRKIIVKRFACAKSEEKVPSKFKLSFSCARKAIIRTAPAILAAAEGGGYSFTFRQLDGCKHRGFKSVVLCDAVVESRRAGGGCVLNHPEPQAELVSAPRGKLKIYWFYGGENQILDCSGNPVPITLGRAPLTSW